MDLCQMFGWKTPKQKFQEFPEMLEAQKRDHVNWVKELKKDLHIRGSFCAVKKSS